MIDNQKSAATTAWDTVRRSPVTSLGKQTVDRTLCRQGVPATLDRGSFVGALRFGCRCCERLAPRLPVVSVFRGIDPGQFERGARVQPALEERRKATRSSVLRTGTLACRCCDAPIDPGTSPILLTELLACPFCDARGPVRDFLSLAIPTRPTRVVVRVALPVR
jgi:hypothetical protein